MSPTLPREPAAAPPTGFRPHMPLAVKLAAALHILGLDPADVDFDHSPPLALRLWDTDAGDTVPPANDWRHITPRGRAQHREKTAGRSTKARAEGDVTEIAKTRRLADQQAAFRNRLTAKSTGAEILPTKRKARIPSRPFRGKR